VWLATVLSTSKLFVNQNSKRDMSKINIANRPVAVVTGAGRTTGIGFETAKQLASKGFHVVLTARNASAANERAAELIAHGFSVTGFELDVADDRSVKQFATFLANDIGKLDVLINNAGVFPAQRDELASTADLQVAAASLEVNLFGPWRLTQAMLPLLRKSDSPRVVNVSSGAGSHADPQFGLTTPVMGTSYPVGKAALNALTVKFSTEEKSHRVLVNAVCPGFTATFPGAEQMGARPVRDGAASVVWAALIADDGPSGGFFRDGQSLGW
jgi:NAD(P)-dependent dehydrogenase (short-subunit alcohol dehydrogenase family)